MSDSALHRPPPDTRNAGAEFWRAAARQQLLVPECKVCRRRFWHPRPACPHCGSNDVGWIPGTGGGSVYTFTVVRQTSDPYFRTQLPYAVAMIELDEGVRLMSNVVGTPVESLRIGMRVQAVFETVADGLAVPLFEVSGGSA